MQNIMKPICILCLCRYLSPLFFTCMLTVGIHSYDLNIYSSLRKSNTEKTLNAEIGFTVELFECVCPKYSIANCDIIL